MADQKPKPIEVTQPAQPATEPTAAPAPTQAPTEEQHGGRAAEPIGADEVADLFEEQTAEEPAAGQPVEEPAVRRLRKQRTWGKRKKAAGKKRSKRSQKR